MVVYDRAAEPLLRWAAFDAERIEAGAPAERSVAQDAISMLLAEKVRDGHTVARLKWGDPFVFDSGAKEAMFLHEQGIPFEVVPGVAMAIGATAYAGIPLTHPESGDAIVFIRGHEAEVDATPGLDWNALAALDGTLVCFAAPRLVARVLGALIDHGRPGDDAAALIYRGTTPAQRTVTGTVAELLARVQDQESETDDPALLVVGEVTRLRDHLRWFDARPLFGRRIILTRSPERARDLSDAIENLGAETVLAPTFRVGPPDDPEAVDRAAASIDRYDWVVFESAVSAARFLNALMRGPRDARALARTAICAIGASTEEELAARGLKADVVIPELRVESIARLHAGARADQRAARCWSCGPITNATCSQQRSRRTVRTSQTSWPTARPRTRRTPLPRRRFIACCSTARWMRSRSPAHLRCSGLRRSSVRSRPPICSTPRSSPRSARSRPLPRHRWGSRRRSCRSSTRWTVWSRRWPGTSRKNLAARRASAFAVPASTVAKASVDEPADKANRRRAG